MFGYVLIVVALFVASNVAPPLGMFLFPIPVAVYWARNKIEFSLGLVACAGIVGYASAHTLGAALSFVLAAAIGLVLGVGIARRWSYGWTVTAVAGLAYALSALNVVAAWDEFEARGAAWCSMQIATIEDRTEGSDDDRAALQIETFSWIKNHWSEIGLGMLLWPLAIGTCIALSAVSAWLRKRNVAAGPRGPFREMRVSEWLVWAVIALAVLWFVDYRWPGSPVRLVAANGTVAISAIYWLNGLSVLAYALGVLKPQFLTSVAVVLVLVWLLGTVLCIVGLFDTWGDFRRVLDRVVAARQRPEQHGDDV